MTWKDIKGEPPKEETDEEKQKWIDKADKFLKMVDDGAIVMIHPDTYIKITAKGKRCGMGLLKKIEDAVELNDLMPEGDMYAVSKDLLSFIGEEPKFERGDYFSLSKGIYRSPFGRELPFGSFTGFPFDV